MPSKQKGVHYNESYLWTRKISAALNCIGTFVMNGTDRFHSVSAPDTSVVLALGWDNVPSMCHLHRLIIFI